MITEIVLLAKQISLSTMLTPLHVAFWSFKSLFKAVIFFILKH